jgi:hypothetical protein
MKNEARSFATVAWSSRAIARWNSSAVRGMKLNTAEE